MTAWPTSLLCWNSMKCSNSNVNAIRLSFPKLRLCSYMVSDPWVYWLLWETPAHTASCTCRYVNHKPTEFWSIKILGKAFCFLIKNLFAQLNLQQKSSSDFKFNITAIRLRVAFTAAKNNELNEVNLCIHFTLMATFISKTYKSMPGQWTKLSWQ